MVNFTMCLFTFDKFANYCINLPYYFNVIVY